MLKSLNEKMSQNQSPLFDRCEKCGGGFKVEGKKWCKRCRSVAEQKNDILTHPKKMKLIENFIIEATGALYESARLDDLKDIKDKLLSLDYGQDVFMFGLVGVGKTHAMAALFRYYTYEGYDCERINFDDFCIKVRSTMSPAAKETEWELTESLKSVDKLFIDDLGLRSKQETDFSYVTLYSILNKRQERRLPTFISSNKSIEQLGQQFDARIASRLQTALIIQLTGKDRRMK